MYGLTLGTRRQGKSTLNLSIAQSLSDTIVIYDPNNQYREWPESTYYTVPMLEAAMTADSTSEEEVPGGKKIYVFRPPAMDPEAGFTDLAGMLWLWNDYTFVVDECSTVQSPARINPYLERAIRQGPADVHILQATHRMTDAHRLTRSLSTDIFFFRTSQKKDAQKIAEEYDDRLEVILPTLGAYQLAHHWRAEAGKEATSIWRDSKAWFIELGHGEKESLSGQKPEAHEDSEPQGQLLDMKIPGIVDQEHDAVHKAIQTSKGGSE